MRGVGRSRARSSTSSGEPDFARFRRGRNPARVRGRPGIRLGNRNDVWFGIAAAFQSRVLLAVAAAYVVPVLWFYIRAEERMMLSEFGDQFAEYARRVGRLAPHLRRGAVGI